MANKSNKCTLYILGARNYWNMAAPAGVDKTLLALLNGIAKRVYFKDDSISDELLRTEVLGGISETGSLLIFATAMSRAFGAEFNQKLKRFQLLLNSIATADMNYNQLDAFLKSQMQKREVDDRS